jgi:rfaE bifunctional protein nucleotidyltransferase chain/domain
MEISTINISTIRNNNINKTIILCHGCFDIFHYGHLMYLKKAKSLGDILVVSLTNDKFIKKGNNRPMQNIHERLEIIDELKCVDYSCISDDYSSINIIKNLKPNVYAKGSDAKGKETNEMENLFHENLELQLIGGKLEFIDVVFGISTTKLLETISF